MVGEHRHVLRPGVHDSARIGPTDPGRRRRGARHGRRGRWCTDGGRRRSGDRRRPSHVAIGSPPPTSQTRCRTPSSSVSSSAGDPSGHAREQVGELRVRTRDRAVDRRQVRAGRAQQAEPVLDGAGHRLLVRDRPTPPHGSSVERDEHPAEPTRRDAVGRRPVHLVGVVRRLATGAARARTPTIRATTAARAYRSSVPAPSPGRDARCCTGSRSRTGAMGLADNVVRRRGQRTERPRDGCVVAQTDRRGRRVASDLYSSERPSGPAMHPRRPAREDRR